MRTTECDCTILCCTRHPTARRGLGNFKAILEKSEVFTMVADLGEEISRAQETFPQ